MKKITKRLALLEELTEGLSGSEINSLLLGFFRKRVEKLDAPAVLRQFTQNRFTGPAGIDTITFKEREIEWLKFARDRGFETITLSPLTPLGTCAAVGLVDQHKVVSALRGTEVVSDATNVLALVMADRFKNKGQNGPGKYVCTHRRVRSHSIPLRNYSAHFGLYCMVTGGIDRGGFSFEAEQLIDHPAIHLDLLSKEFERERLFTRIYLKEENARLQQALQEGLGKLDGSHAIETEPAFDHGKYYRFVQFRVFLRHRDKDINLADGGPVDWTQQLIGNKKHRFSSAGPGSNWCTK
jgi:hypothetical protein